MKPPHLHHRRDSGEGGDALRAALARYVTDPTDLGRLLEKTRSLPGSGGRYCLVLEVNPHLWIRAELPRKGIPAVELFDPNAMCGRELVSRHEFPDAPERAIAAALEVALGHEVFVHYSVSIVGTGRQARDLLA